MLSFIEKSKWEVIIVDHIFVHVVGFVVGGWCGALETLSETYDAH